MPNSPIPDSDIHDVPLRESAGRDTIMRFQMQFQATAYAALEILKGSEIDRVYCDYQDDFVVRRVGTNGTSYVFYQVKTKNKKNHLWTLSEVFALKKKNKADDIGNISAIAESFAGKLFLHSINFGDSCEEIVLLTNIQFKDEVENIVKELAGGNITSSQAEFLVENFSKIFESASTFDRSKVIDNVRKLRLEPGIKYVGEDNAEFASAARSAIYKYSEIDLEHDEIEAIAASLVSLINRKSFSKILNSYTKEQLDDAVGVGIEDLLAILSISREVYQALLDGQDESVLRNASMIQRKMKVAGASDRMIEFSTQQKVNWDIWLRNTRHSVPEFELNFLLEKIQKTQGDWMRQGGLIVDLQNHIDVLFASNEVKNISSLTKTLLLGAILAAMVRTT